MQNELKIDLTGAEALSALKTEDLAFAYLMMNGATRARVVDGFIRLGVKYTTRRGELRIPYAGELIAIIENPHLPLGCVIATDNEGRVLRVYRV